MSARSTLAVSLGGLAVAIAFAGVWLAWATRGAVLPPGMEAGPGPMYFLGWLAFALVGAVLAQRRGGNLVGWILLSVGLAWEFSGLTGVYRVHALVTSPGASMGVWAAWAWDWSWLPGVALVWPLVLVFPDGRLPSRAWTPVPLLLLAATAALFVSVALRPGPLPNTPDVTNPAGIEAVRAFGAPLEAVGSLAFVAGALAALAALIIRYRRGGATERQQLKWFAWAAIVVAIAWLSADVLEASGANVDLATIRLVPLLLLPLATAIAVLRYRLYDIDVVIHRSLVYGTLAAAILLLYFVVVIGAGSLAGAGSGGQLWLSVLATAIAALAFAPIRTRLDRLADRVIFGRRPSPYEVLRLVTAGAEERSNGAEVLTEIARTVAQAVAGGSGEVWLPLGGELRLQGRWPADGVASTGEAQALPLTAGEPLVSPGDGAHVYPVRRHERLLGALVVRKPQQERLTPAEDALLRDIAAAAWLVLDHAQLAGELRASRQRLVAAQHTERRKVERDLHDGAQQRLLEVALTLGGARANAERGDVEETVVALDTADVQLRAALAELRELARGIHPEILSSRGLVPALQSLAERSPLPVTLEVHASERVQPHIEATAYFVAAEALTNAIKHAHADSVTISVALCDGALRLAVLDDGVGRADPSGPGLRGLADRVAALDGRFEVVPAPGGGTCVRAEVPCGSS